MLKLRKSNERGFAEHGWLKSFHTFSFANYYDPKFMGFRSLRVINEDRIAGGTGFDSHPHDNMEIITYVVKGGLIHNDSTGTKSIIRPGEIQRMSAGSGVVHSEYNYMEIDETHLFQIWIRPNDKGGTPGYAQKSFADQLDSKKLVLVVSENGREGSIKIKQDADLYLARLNSNEEVDFKLRRLRGAWVQVIHGRLSVNGQEIETGDGVAIEGDNDQEEFLVFQAIDQSEFMLFDLA